MTKQYTAEEIADILVELVLPYHEYCDVELHPDDCLALTWRRQAGIINLSFNGNNEVSWACFFEGGDVSDKGEFKLTDGVPIKVINYIKKVENHD